MSSILESLSKVRELLDYPVIQKPSLHQLYGGLVRNVQNLYNRLNNTNEAWTFGEAGIDVVAGVDTYTVSPTQSTTLGKPLLLTTYSTDQSAVERVIPFSDIQNLKFDWFMPENFRGVLGFPTGGEHYAERASVFFEENGLCKVRFLPVPQAAATYRLKYTFGNWADRIALSGSPILTQFHHLFELQTALDFIDLAEWEGYDDKKNDTKRSGREKSLLRQIQQPEMDFNQYKKEMTHDGISRKKGIFD